MTIAITLGAIASIQLFAVCAAVTQMRVFTDGLGAELPMPIRVTFAIFRYPVLAVGAVVVFAILVRTARFAKTYRLFVVAWLVSAVGAAGVLWTLWIVNHVLAGQVH